MVIEPTVGEVIFYVGLAIISLAAIIVARLPWNDRYNPKGDDPYRFCPKEEDM